MAISEAKMRSNEDNKINLKKQKSVTFENYLLTPKDEDYYEKSPSPDFPIQEIDQLNDEKNFEKNPDYIALTSCLRLLKNNKSQITKEIIELSDLIKQLNDNNDDKQVMNFLRKLLTNKLKLPKQNKIVKCPIIKISKYQTPNLPNYNEKPVFKTLNLFNNSVTTHTPNSPPHD